MSETVKGNQVYKDITVTIENKVILNIAKEYDCDAALVSIKVLPDDEEKYIFIEKLFAGTVEAEHLF